MNPLFFQQEALLFTPITEYNAKLDLSARLDHGFKDIPFFPTGGEFLLRSQGHFVQYPNYMVYLFCKSSNLEIMGLIAVQHSMFDNLKTKVQPIVPEISHYLYLSWIALDQKYRTYNYFTVLFEFYHSLIRRMRRAINDRVEGAAIIIRRMRPVLWSLLNKDEPCPNSTNKIMNVESRRFSLLIKPSEIIDSSLTPPQDHIFIVFNPPKYNH